jgi:DNA-binding transcriptional MocR family regulator
VPPSHGLFVWARLAKGARCAGDEKRFFEDLLARTGVKVGEGRFYRGAEGEFGWARLRFSMPEAEMRDAVARMEGVMGKGAE